MNREEKLNTEKSGSCACPFCDEPICPDPEGGDYTCGNKKLKVHRVDCVGLYCPVPVMRAKDEIDALEEGNLMELVADDPASAEDIPRWAKRAGHRFLTMQRKEDEYIFLIQKGQPGEAKQ